MANNAKVREPLIHISKRDTVPLKFSIIVRAIAIVSALLLCALLASFTTKGGFFGFFIELFSGLFGTPRRIWNLLQALAILLGISLAVTPAFKMKFWNIGAEGQTLIAGLACAACMKFLGGTMPEFVLILISLIASIIAGAVWAAIPAIFKAFWNTNETLFTLMMNYVAMNLVRYFVFAWVPNGSAVVGIIPHGHLPALFGQQYLINIISVAFLTAFVYIYLKESKHGYELTVVGESENTARYIGINVKKVVIRTMIFSGILCGVVGFLLVAGTAFTINDAIVGGRGFTAILVSWLGKFNPLYMILTALLTVSLQQGANQIATVNRMPGAFADLIVGIVFFFIIACEFFLKYKVKIRTKHAQNDSNVNKEVKA